MHGCLAPARRSLAHCRANTPLIHSGIVQRSTQGCTPQACGGPHRGWVGGQSTRGGGVMIMGPIGNRKCGTWVPFSESRRGGGCAISGGVCLEAPSRFGNGDYRHALVPTNPHPPK